MSRICVKNLPKYVAEDRLRDLFSQKGEITDAKLMRTKDGKSRQFAFIGFRSEREAEEAIEFFNKSYIDTCRITCEIALKVGDPDVPRPWSRHSLAKEKKVTENANKSNGAKSSSFSVAEDKMKTNKKSSENDDPQLLEFLQIMQPHVKSKLWANDLLVDPKTSHNVKVGEENNQKMEGGREKSDSEKLELNQSNSHFDKSCNLALNEVVSDMDYFNSRVKKEFSDSESDVSSIDDEDNENDEGSNSLQEILDIKDAQTTNHNEERGDAKVKALSEDSDGEILDHGNSESALKDENLEPSRLFVRNLPFTATEEELQDHFSMFGDVSLVHLVLDRETKRSKGIAYIHYTLPESASRALEELDNSIFQGRLLHVMPAKQKESSNKLEKAWTDISASQVSKTFKQKKLDERKAAEASGDTRAWNTMFMRPDTVVENMTRLLGVSKTVLLDRESDDIAVRIALGEAQVIAETKKALANSGVNVKCLEDFANGNSQGLKRSNHILLVKNLPYGSSEGELAKMFGKFGSLDKIILPPTKTLALVIFLEPSEARAAFRGLSYKRYKDAPLYLEWASADILNGDSSFKGEEKYSDILGKQFADASSGVLDVDIDPDRIESRSLFVKNLNFKTSDESLKEHLGKHIKDGKILSVRIKKHLKNGKNVSMGFGFIEFDSVETATNSCKDLQGTILDGHALILQLCHAKKEQVVKKVEKDKSSTKLLVRNVAFEATKKDLRQLFSPFGQIKNLRLPMKFGNHRGFAFVEFVTKQEAQNALEALANTHLYGRHLVLERAKEGETLEELRVRTTAQFTDEQSGYQNSTKLSKKRKQVAVLDEGSMKFRRLEE